MSNYEHVEAVCGSCNGSGVRAREGMEYDGFAVVCQPCGGSGCIKLQYVPFTGRTHRADIHTVIETNPGFVVGKREGCQFGGMPYDTWERGEPWPHGHEMRDLVCPEWYCKSQGVPVSLGWQECLGCLGRRFDECSHFEDKHECWDKYDQQMEGSSDE